MSLREQQAVIPDPTTSQEDDQGLDPLSLPHPTLLVGIPCENELLYFSKSHIPYLLTGRNNAFFVGLLEGSIEIMLITFFKLQTSNACS